MDSEDFHSHDRSWGAYARLEQMKTGWRQGAAASIRREIADSGGNSLGDFVPFVKERGKLGKLLQTKRELSLGGELAGMFESQTEDYEAPGLLVRHHPRLGKVVEKVTTPGVGTYSFQSSLLKHSFSTRRTKPNFPEPLRQAEKRQISSKFSQQKLVPRYEYTIKPKIKRVRPPDKYDILRPEILLEKTRRTNFQLVHLDDSPDDISNSVQILERRKLKDEHLASAKRLMQKLLKGRFS